MIKIIACVNVITKINRPTALDYVFIFLCLCIVELGKIDSLDRFESIRQKSIRQSESNG